MKIRLVGGPFGGKVLDDPSGGNNELVYRGEKKMSRKKKWEAMADRTTHFDYMSGRWLPPQVEARYQIAMGIFNEGTMMVRAPLRHPDGSLFYTYVEGSRRELG